MRSERNIFVHHPARRFDIALRNVSGTCAEKLHVQCDNLGTVLLRSSIAGFPRSRPQAPFDVHLATLVQILCAGLRQLSEDHDIVPVNALLFLSLLIKEHVVGCDREARNRCAAGRDVAQFRLLSEVSDYHCFVQCHYSDSWGLFSAFAKRVEWNSPKPFLSHPRHLHQKRWRGRATPLCCRATNERRDATQEAVPERSGPPKDWRGDLEQNDTRCGRES